PGRRYGNGGNTKNSLVLARQMPIWARPAPWKLSATGTSLAGDRQVEERGVLLGAEDVALARAAAGAVAANGELDGQARIVLDEGGEALARDAVETRDGLGGEGAAPLHAFVALPVREDDVEGDLVHAGVLAPDGLGHLDERLGRHPATAESSMAQSSRGSASGRTWFTVHS